MSTATGDSVYKISSHSALPDMRRKMKLCDLLWKKSETNGKARCERIGTLIGEDGRKIILSA